MRVLAGGDTPPTAGRDRLHRGGSWTRGCRPRLRGRDGGGVNSRAWRRVFVATSAGAPAHPAPPAHDVQRLGEATADPSSAFEALVVIPADLRCRPLSGRRRLAVARIGHAGGVAKPECRCRRRPAELGPGSGAGRRSWLRAARRRPDRRYLGTRHARVRPPDRAPERLTPPRAMLAARVSLSSGDAPLRARRRRDLRPIGKNCEIGRLGASSSHFLQRAVPTALPPVRPTRPCRSPRRPGSLACTRTRSEPGATPAGCAITGSTREATGATDSVTCSDS